MNYSLAIHGGAGTILPNELTPEKEARYLGALKNALQAGGQILRQGGTALDAVTAAVVSLEDNDLFNAGRGSVYTHDRVHEMDACIAQSNDRKCGAVAGVSTIKNPIKAARAVMEQSQHVLLAGKGAEGFAKSIGLESVPESYFGTEQRLKQLEVALAQGTLTLDHAGPAKPPKNEGKFGTVGAVAIDQYGSLAAATSTGGVTGKRWGRVGDTPIVGAGTWADSRVAISCTGWGEVFIRYGVAHRVAALMEMKGLALHEACQQVIVKELGEAEPDSGGLIAVDKEGNLSLPYNSAGMYRGICTSSGLQAGIFEDLKAL